MIIFFSVILYYLILFDENMHENKHESLELLDILLSINLTISHISKYKKNPVICLLYVKRILLRLKNFK